MIHSHSRWYSADRIGADNLPTVERRLAALASVRQGRIYNDSHEIYMGVPNQTPFPMSICGRRPGSGSQDPAHGRLAGMSRQP